MAEREALTAERVRQLLDYNPETGEFRWRERPIDLWEDPKYSRHTREGNCQKWNTKWAGKIAGTIGVNGYVSIRILKNHIYAHRLAWLYVTGELPFKHIDHRNGKRTDNRFENLREANKSENGQNQKLRINNKSGFMGASFDRRRGKWTAQIGIAEERKFLGYFSTPEEAHQAYVEAKSRLHTFQPTIREDATK